MAYGLALPAWARVRVSRKKVFFASFFFRKKKNLPSFNPASRPPLIGG
jgi:hypothetical protein